MLTASPCFVMSSLPFWAVGRRGFGWRRVFIMQIAMTQNDIIAKCNPGTTPFLFNSLILLVLI
jgi:Mg/Co/Ni transporter MgtE